MVDQIAVVPFEIAGTGTLPITSSSITAAFSAAILIFTKETTDNANNTHAVLGIGFIGVDGSDAQTNLQCTVAIQTEDGEDVSRQSNTTRDQTTCLEVSDGLDATPIVISANYGASIAGGFELDVTLATNNTKGIAILFAGLSKAAAGACTFNTVGGHEDVGLSPFWEPDLVILRSSDNTVSGATPNATLALGFAINNDALSQISSYINIDEATDPTDSDGFIRSDAASCAFSGTNRTIMDRFLVTSFDSTGFNGIAPEATTSPQANYLALKFSGFVRLACANLAAPSSTGIQTYTDFGFNPTVVLGMSSLMASLDTLIDGATASAAGYFVTGIGSRAYTVHDEEGKNIGAIGPVLTSAHTRQEDVAVLTYEHTGGIAQRATWGGQSGDNGFKLDFSVATAGFLTALGIQAGVTYNETVSISETVFLVLEVVAPVANDTVEISESANLVPGEFLVAPTETVTISDGCVFVLADGLDPLGPDGDVFQGGPVVGEVFSLGAVDGDVVTN